MPDQVRHDEQWRKVIPDPIRDDGKIGRLRMATLAQLKTRIILDTARDDLSAGGELAQALTDAIADAVEAYADEPFWFNSISGEVATSVNIATATLPAGMRAASLVPRAGSRLRKVPLASVQGRIET